MTFDIITLGCRVNEYESQYYRSRLMEAGYTPVKEGEPADLVIINTCSVTNTAAAKSRKKIHSARRNSPHAFIAAVGCYIQTLEDQNLIPEADLFIGSKGKKDLVSAIEEGLKDHAEQFIIPSRQSFEFEQMPIARFEGQHRAFLKIQDGCNQFCTYCQIPFARGVERCLSFDEAVDGAKALADAGHLEIVLTGIHTGRYQDQGKDLADLLEAMLEATPEDVCFRISSIEVSEITDQLIDLMKNNDRMLPWMHIPIQAGSDETLKRMNRPYTVADYKAVIDKIRSEIPDMAISTDVLTGFVAESEEEFEETVQTLKDIGFSFLHVFPYSRRANTAADRMKGHLDGRIIKERAHALLKLSDELRHQHMAGIEEADVLIERQEGNSPLIYTGYTDTYQPVRLICDHELSGRIKAVKKGIEDGTLIMEPAKDNYANFENV